MAGKSLKYVSNSKNPAIILLLLFVFIINITISQAQTIDRKIKYKNVFIETKIHYGFIIKHHKKIEHLQGRHFSAFEINSGIQTFGTNKWDKLYNYPRIGYVFWYSDLGRSPYLGSAYAFYPYMNFHIINKKKFFFNFRFGMGLGYLSKKFDQHTNYKNIAIGSHLNAAISLLFETRWKINQQLSLSSGIGLTHFSNGAFKTPNLGINIPTFNIGASWFILKKQADKIETNLPPLNKKFEFNSFLSFGFKEMYPPLHKKYFTCSYSGILFNTKNHKKKYGLGLDLFYNTGNLYVLDLSSNNFNSNISIIRIGISLAYEIRYNNLSFLIQTGPYIRSKDKSDGTIYTRIGIRYAVSDHWFLNLSLKTHFAKADNIECGLGYKF